MRLWKWLEGHGSRTAVMAEWRVVCGDALPAIQPMLCPIDRPASRYPNPRRYGQPMKVVYHRDGSIVAIDEDDWHNRFDLAREDTVLHELDLGELRKTICRSLSNLITSRTPIPPVVRRLQVGNWEPKKAASFPVYLLLCRQRNILRTEVLDLVVTCKKPGAILLTPTRLLWDDEIEKVIRPRNMLLVPLCEVLDVSELITETAAWEEYLQTFCQMVKLTLPGNYRNRKRPARRGELVAKVEKVKKTLVAYIISARDGVVANIDASKGAQLVKALKRNELAKLAGLKPWHITRCFNADPQLARLYQIANDPEDLLKYGRHRQ